MGVASVPGEWSLGLVIVLALVLAAEFVNGWTDAPHAIATVGATRGPRQGGLVLLEPPGWAVRPAHQREPRPGLGAGRGRHGHRWDRGPALGGLAEGAHRPGLLDLPRLRRGVPDHRRRLPPLSPGPAP